MHQCRVFYCQIFFIQFLEGFGSAKVSFNWAEGAVRDALRGQEILTGQYPKSEILESTQLPSLPNMSVAGSPAKILAQQEMELERALSNAKDALRFTEFRYESAETDLLNVLSVQQRVSFIEAQLVSTRRARLVQYINLSLALGVEP